MILANNTGTQTYSQVMQGEKYVLPSGLGKSNIIWRRYIYLQLLDGLNLTRNLQYLKTTNTQCKATQCTKFIQQSPQSYP